MWSTVSPAFTISITRRGRLSNCDQFRHRVRAHYLRCPRLRSLMKSSTLETVRLNTATL